MTDRPTAFIRNQDGTWDTVFPAYPLTNHDLTNIPTPPPYPTLLHTMMEANAHLLAPLERILEVGYE